MMNVFVFSYGRQPPYLCSRRRSFFFGRKENIQVHTCKLRKGEGAPAAEQLQLTSDRKGKKTIAVHKANNAILN